MSARCSSARSAVIWLGGIVDAVMYLITRLTERGRDILTLCAMRQAADPTELTASLLTRCRSWSLPLCERLTWRPLRARLIQLPEPADRPRLDKDDFFGAVGVLPRFPVHVSGGDSVCFHAQRHAGRTHFRWRCHRDALPGRLFLGAAPGIVPGRWALQWCSWAVRWWE